MNELLKRARNIVLNGGLRTSYGTRQPVQYDDRGYEYFADPSHLHRAQMLQYASDFFAAKIQNWDMGGAWEDVRIRMADFIKPTAAINRRLEEYKMIIPEDPSINYLRPGTKIECMGSTWIVVNPDNISGGDHALSNRHAGADGHGRQHLRKQAPDHGVCAGVCRVRKRRTRKRTKRLAEKRGAFFVWERKSVENVGRITEKGAAA